MHIQRKTRNILRTDVYWLSSFRQNRTYFWMLNCNRRPAIRPFHTRFPNAQTRELKTKRKLGTRELFLKARRVYEITLFYRTRGSIPVIALCALSYVLSIYCDGVVKRKESTLTNHSMRLTLII